MLNSENSLTNYQRLESQSIKIQADIFKFLVVSELRCKSVLFLGKLDLFGESGFLPHFTSRSPVLERALRIVMFIEKSGAKQFKCARDSLRTVV